MIRVGSILIVVLFSFGLVSAQDPIINAPFGSATLIDGRIGADEYAGSAEFDLTGGGRIFVRHDGEHLYIGVKGLAYGWCHLYTSEDGSERVNVYHASAALGTTNYAPGKDGKWQPSGPFAWEVRDTVIDDATRAKMDAYLAKHFWVANNNNTGSKNEIEFKVKPKNGVKKALRFAIVFAIGRSDRHYFPATLADDTRNDQLVQGNTPADLKFDTKQWARVKFGKRSKK